MNKPNQSTNDGPGTLADEARELMAATAEMNDEKINQARKRLADALQRGREIAGEVRAKAIAGARSADAAVRENPYQAVAIGVGVGLLAGYLLGRRGSRPRD